MKCSSNTVFVSLHYLKSDSYLPGKLFLFASIKALSFLRYLHFCADFLVMQKNGFTKKLRLFSKFMTLQTGQQINTLLPSILRGKGNQTMKFGPLNRIEREKYFSLKFIHNRWRRSQSQTLLYKNQICAYLWIKSRKCYKVSFYCMAKSRSTKIY